MEVDRLKLTLGMPFEVGKYYMVHPFTIQKIAEIGYEKWGYIVNMFLLSWEDLNIDIDEEEKTDERLYKIMFKMFVDDESDKFFNTFNQSCKEILNRKLVKSKYDLYDIDKKTLSKVKGFFTPEVFGQMRKIVKAQNLIEKKDDEKRKFANEEARKLYERIKKNRKVVEKYKDKPDLSDLVSALRWKKGVTKKDVLKMTLYELYDGLKRVNTIDSVRNLKNGIYSGSIKYDDIDKEELDWMKKIKINKVKGG